MLPRSHIDVAALEEMRESGDYDKIANLLGDDWRLGPACDEQTIRRRLLAAELAGRNGGVEDMEAALNPYIENTGHVPFELSARVLLMTAMYHYRRHEPTEALRLATLSATVARVRDEEFVTGEAVQLQGQALWALERWEEAAQRFEDAIAAYAG